MAALDYSRGASATQSARHGVAVTPSDDTDLGYTTRAVYVGTGGDLEVNMATDGDTPVTLVIPGVPSGTFLPICVTRVLAGNTDADGIVAFW